MVELYTGYQRVFSCVKSCSMHSQGYRQPPRFLKFMIIQKTLIDSEKDINRFLKVFCCSSVSETTQSAIKISELVTLSLAYA